MINRAILAALILLAGAKYGFAADPPPCSMGYDNVGVLRSAVAMAVSAAPDGTVICLQAGSATGADAWTSKIDLTPDDKCVEVRGHGTMPLQGSAGETIIEVNNSGAAFQGKSMASSSCTFDNIRFKVNETDTLPFAIITWNRNGSGTLPWIIHHNDFQLTGTCAPGNALRMIQTGEHNGVIYRNRFTAEVIVGGGCDSTNTNVNGIAHDVTDDGAYWGSASTFGNLDTDGQNLYVETNYFENLNVALDANSSSRIVWRFNTMANASWVDHGFDSSTTGDRQQETYNNEWVCDQAFKLGAYFTTRGATHRIFNNTFPVRDPAKCGLINSTAADLRFSSFKLFECDVIGGWPGQYNGGTGSTTYPQSHQIGWGWVSGPNQTVGASNAQNQPGLNGYPTDGFAQALEPAYIFNNTNNSGNLLTYIDEWIPGSCRAMAYSNTGKTSSATLVIPNASATGGTPYVNVGQEAVVVFSDLAGGTAPTIADSLGNSWSALTGGTNGSQRLTAWHSHITTGGAMVVTITFPDGATSAARAGSVIIMRGMTASPVDQNPATANATGATTFDAPTVGGVGGSALAQTNEIVLGYYALNGPTTYNHSTLAFESDVIAVTSPDTMAISCRDCTGMYNLGIMGTTGSTGTSNTTVGVTYRSVTSTGAVNPEITDVTARNAVMGTVTFKVTSNDNQNLDLQTRDFIQFDREIYNQNDTFTGTSGTGTGSRASRPSAGSSVNGVGYWADDAGGNWDTSNGSANDGCLDIMVSGSWVNCSYTPAVYPNVLADVTGGSVTPSVASLTPATGIQGATSLSIAVVGSNTNFVNATTVCDFGANITVNSCTVSSATTLTASITISAGAVIGGRDATFTTGGEVATSSGGFTVSSGGLFIKKIAPRKFRKL